MVCRTVCVELGLIVASVCLFSNAYLDPEEARAATYFGKTTPHGEPQSVPRYSNLSLVDFERLALSGKPFVIEDGAKGQPFLGWTCERFRKEYPNGVVKMEYVRDAKDPFKLITSQWESTKHAIKNADPGGPQYAPWYWGVKASDDPEEARTVFKGGKNPLPKVQQSMRLPPWMRSSSENTQEVLGSPEFWFSIPNAGAAMHMDGHCESTYAIQLSGKRRWRIGWVPPVPNGSFYKNGAYADAAIYGKGYSPPLEAVVEEGQAFFMPSAFLHETNNIGDGCAVSLTFQFRDPIPARYFRHSLRHLRRSGDFNECWRLLGQVASFGQKVAKGSHPSYGAADRDNDGRLSLDEATTNLLRAGHAFHDVDDDGFATHEEVKQGWSAWLAANEEAKGKGVKKVTPKSYGYLNQDPRSVEL